MPKAGRVEEETYASPKVPFKSAQNKKAVRNFPNLQPK
ncbi:hypothetical protein JCM19236_1398 [Vibrio sp. JCM 19236]|nr:hypothetical protein JCM19236_1398 [Vibrio sp. JCM 19236]